MTDQPLAGRAALVTGGAGRIGAVIAATLMRDGARVAISDLRPDALDRVVQTAPGLAAVQADITDAADVTRMVDAAEAAVGPLDILVAAAGIFPNCPLLERSRSDWNRN